MLKDKVYLLPTRAESIRQVFLCIQLNSSTEKYALVPDVLLSCALLPSDALHSFNEKWKEKKKKKKNQRKKLVRHRNLLIRREARFESSGPIIQRTLGAYSNIIKPPTFDVNLNM